MRGEMTLRADGFDVSGVTESPRREMMIYVFPIPREPTGDGALDRA